MEIKASEIRELIELLLEYQKENEKETFRIPYDYYWDIVKEERYAPHEKPSTFTMGQLSWDIENLRETLAKKHDPAFIDFIWLGQILIAIGESDLITSPQKKSPEDNT